MKVLRNFKDLTQEQFDNFLSLFHGFYTPRTVTEKTDENQFVVYRYGEGMDKFTCQYDTLSSMMSITAEKHVLETASRILSAIAAGDEESISQLKRSSASQQMQKTAQQSGLPSNQAQNTPHASAPNSAQLSKPQTTQQTAQQPSKPLTGQKTAPKQQPSKPLTGQQPSKQPTAQQPKRTAPDRAKQQAAQQPLKPQVTQAAQAKPRTEQKTALKQQAAQQQTTQQPSKPLTGQQTTQQPSKQTAPQDRTKQQAAQTQATQAKPLTAQKMAPKQQAAQQQTTQQLSKQIAPQDRTKPQVTQTQAAQAPKQTAPDRTKQQAAQQPLKPKTETVATLDANIDPTAPYKDGYSLQKYDAVRLETGIERLRNHPDVATVTRSETQEKTTRHSIRFEIVSKAKTKVIVQYAVKGKVVQIQGKPSVLSNMVQSVLSESVRDIDIVHARLDYNKTQQKAKRADDKTKQPIAEVSSEKSKPSAAEKSDAKKAMQIKRGLEKALPHAILYLSKQSQTYLYYAMADLNSDLSNYSGILATAYQGLENLVSKLQLSENIRVKMIGQAYDKDDNGKYSLKSSYRKKIDSIVYAEVLADLYTAYFEKRHFFTHSDNIGDTVRVIEDKQLAKKELDLLFSRLEYNCKKLSEIHFSTDQLS